MTAIEVLRIIVSHPRYKQNRRIRAIPINGNYPRCKISIYVLYSLEYKTMLFVLEIKRHKRKTAASSVLSEIKRLDTKISSMKEMSLNTELDVCMKNVSRKRY